MAISYGLSFTENPAASTSYAVVPASIYVAKTINASLANTVLTGTESLDDRRKRPQQETDMVADMYYTITAYASYAGVPTILRTLGGKMFLQFKAAHLSSMSRLRPHRDPVSLFRFLFANLS